jgi:hypothetical protein
LPSSLREVWFKRLEALGIEPGEADVPDEMRTDSWWRKDRL